jgi:hypothetical protein
MIRAKKYVECGGHVPAYQNFLCEDCWKKALNEKLQNDSKNKRKTKVK